MSEWSVDMKKEIAEAKAIIKKMSPKKHYIISGSCTHYTKDKKK